MSIRCQLTMSSLALLLAAGLPACEGKEHAGQGDADSDGDSDGDTDGDSDGDADGDGDSDPGALGTIRGTVLAPNGTTPISGALVYLAAGDVEEIPEQIYCYECDDMTGKKWTLSGPDGSWTIADALAGTHNLVTRKGFFRRQRQIEVVAGTVTDIPAETTTLPAEKSGDGLDVIPRYGVLIESWDRSHDLLAKLGLGVLDGSGHLVFGTEKFDLYNDSATQAGYPDSSQLFASQADLDKYHMLFFPCFATHLGVAFANQHAEMLREYVYGGGKQYTSCCVALWNVAPFPGYIDYYGNDSPSLFDIGRISSSAYSTTGETLDPDMAAWLEVVGVADAAHVPFTDGYVKIDSLNDVNDGYGLEEDDYWVLPKMWVVDNGSYPGSPLIATYNWGCGKVFYSVYETSHVAQSAITPQEHVLLYVILEVGVCEGEYEPPV